MQFTEQHDAIRNTVSRFVSEELNPNIEEWEEAQTMPCHEILKKAGNLGLLGIAKPEAYGGLALDYSYQAVFAEELGAARHGSSPLLLGVHTMMSTPALALHGSHELCEEFLAPAIAGDVVTSIAVSEPHAGSDVAAIKTTARSDGDDYLINGTKMWITNSTQADYFCLLANTGDTCNGVRDFDDAGRWAFHQVHGLHQCREKLTVYEDDFRFAMIEDVGDGVDIEACVDCVKDRTTGGDTECSFGLGGNVGQDCCHNVAGRDTDFS